VLDPNKKGAGLSGTKRWFGQAGWIPRLVILVILVLECHMAPTSQDEAIEPSESRFRVDPVASTFVLSTIFRRFMNCNYRDVHGRDRTLGQMLEELMAERTNRRDAVEDCENCRLLLSQFSLTFAQPFAQPLALSLCLTLPLSPNSH
jgi:hypothetical protein